jgi:hypothetical protein
MSVLYLYVVSTTNGFEVCIEYYCKSLLQYNSNIYFNMYCDDSIKKKR